MFRSSALMAKLLLEKTITQPGSYDWSLQGLGMFRLYLSPEVRLHLFDTRHAVKDVSTVHTHPWNFKSTILVGQILNTRLQEYSYREQGSSPYRKSTIQCGTGGGLVRGSDEPHCHPGEGELVFLARRPTERYRPGGIYYQEHSELHESVPMLGTITICERNFVNADRDHAAVYWPHGTQWVSAEPRAATHVEITDAATYCLSNWQKLTEGVGIFL